MTDLTTTYLGLELRSPLVCSSGPLCEDLDNLRRMEDHGAGAVVLHSLFEEQLRADSEDLDRFLASGTESFPEALSYFPDLTDYKLGPETYLEHIRKAKEALGIPVIASLNGVSEGGWVQYAREIERAGADALELNVYYLPTDPALSGKLVEQMYTSLVRSVRAEVSLPLAVKLGPFFSAPAAMAARLAKAGASSLVLFNRFYQPDFDLETLEVRPALNLSQSSELLLRLHWVAIIFGRVPVDLAITGGVHTANDVLKSMMAGARVTMMTSVLLERGLAHLETVREGVVRWMVEHEYESIRQMQGSMSMRSVAEPAAFERANYLKVLRSHRRNR